MSARGFTRVFACVAVSLTPARHDRAVSPAVLVGLRRVSATLINHQPHPGESLGTFSKLHRDFLGGAGGMLSSVTGGRVGKVS